MCLQDVTADEFHICMTILGSTKLGTSVTGHAELVALAVEQADLDASLEADVNEDEVVERYIQCATHALPYFSVSSFRYMFFLLHFSNFIGCKLDCLVASRVNQVHQIHDREDYAADNVEPDWCHRTAGSDAAAFA